MGGYMETSNAEQDASLYLDIALYQVPEVPVDKINLDITGTMDVQSLMDVLMQDYKSIGDNQKDRNYTLFNTANVRANLAKKGMGFEPPHPAAKQKQGRPQSLLGDSNPQPPTRADKGQFKLPWPIWAV
ncbi:hypothetical protein DSO57_1001350 [Entomophthora muscae]|uniref:Uncharacterized protein n=1 Tax=Entomophthora muscae TaxID=34485 RepID=A0ACC2SY10_9FUNG|nr:hypothetical protein DSO57_1001350 [Entomophthora muscae]